MHAAQAACVEKPHHWRSCLYLFFQKLSVHWNARFISSNCGSTFPNKFHYKRYQIIIFYEIFHYYTHSFIFRTDSRKTLNPSSGWQGENQSFCNNVAMSICYFLSLYVRNQGSPFFLTFMQNISCYCCCLLEFCCQNEYVRKCQQILKYYYVVQ